MGPDYVWRNRLNKANHVAAKIADVSPCERYFWRSHPLQQRAGSALFADLFQPQTAPTGIAGIATLLESPHPLPAHSLPDQAAQMARYSICAGPPRIVNGQAQLWTPKIGQIFPLLQRLQQMSDRAAIPDEIPDHLPFIGGWLGWLGYDTAWEIEKLPWLKADTLPFPVAFWYEPAKFAVLDHHLQQLWLAAETPSALDDMTSKAGTSNRASALTAIHSDQNPVSEINASVYSVCIDKKDKKDQMLTQDLTFEASQTHFHQAVQQAKAHIRAGDVFQVNHSLRFRAQTSLSSWEIYKRLHRINPSPFASYWQTPWGAVVSCSPERLVQLQNGIAQSRPIAGTRPRGRTVSEDTASAQALSSDRKEQAEHIMLVDLERNDLGRVCQWGSVQVSELMTIERYSHVMHLVSNVIGKLQPDHSAAQLISAMFPGGTITGCPKVRCMEIIESLEPVRRSLFYGSCGYLDQRGHLDLNILIRTLLVSTHAATPPRRHAAMSTTTISATTVWGQVGAGIVADSDPEREWQESLQKAKAQLLALGL